MSNISFACVERASSEILKYTSAFLFLQLSRVDK